MANDINEYMFYRDIATRIFKFMNGRVNILNSNCTLYIDFTDFTTHNLATIRYPSSVILHLQEIINTFDRVPEYKGRRFKHDSICSLIALSLCHEMLHTDQYISMMEYNSNPKYKESIENDVECASTAWVIKHATDLEVIGNFRITTWFIPDSYMNKPILYKRATPEQFYKQTIINIICRDLNSVPFVERALSYPDVELIFNEQAHISIKMHNQYIAENIPAFSTLVNAFAGMWDLYTVETSMHLKPYRGKEILLLKFEFSNGLFRPVVFSDRTIPPV